MRVHTQATSERNIDRIVPSLIFYTDLIMHTQMIRNLRITEEQESGLVEMISFFNDNGWINEESSADYDSLAETICDPGFWEYE